MCQTSGPKQFRHVYACVLHPPSDAHQCDGLSNQHGKTSSRRLGTSKEEVRGLCRVSVRRLRGAKGQHLHLRCFVMLEESEQV